MLNIVFRITVEDLFKDTTKIVRQIIIGKGSLNSNESDKNADLISFLEHIKTKADAYSLERFTG